MKKLLIPILLLFIFNIVQAQVITVDPAFPTADDAVTITLNTTGTGLDGYDGDVYTHTGITVDDTSWRYVIGSWGNNTTQPKLTKIGENLYQLELTPSIREFYGAAPDDSISELCFVFRSADGTQQTSPDIFYPVYKTTSLNIMITFPEIFPYITKLNDTIHIEGGTSKADSTFIFVNDVKIYADTGESFTTDIIADTYGKFWVKAIAKNDTGMVADSFYYYVRSEPIIEPVPENIINGINYLDDTTVILCLFAPYKNYAFVIGDFGNWEVGNQWYMKKDTATDQFWLQISGLEPKKEYAYQYYVDGNIKISDPYTQLVLDPWNDKYISEDTYPNLKQYPYGKTDGLVAVLQTDQDVYNWQNTDFTAPAETDLVIYELLVRDFVAKHDYQAMTDTLSYFKRLGVNAIELMPVNEFDGNINWGYSPNHYFAPDKYYGPKHDLQQFIDACHGEGIAVILDVVYNHSTNLSPYCELYWNKELNRPAANSPFYNEIPKHDFNVYNDMNHESPATKEYISRAIKFWLSEYHVDGYRFDLSKGFTQKNTLGNPSAGAQYDQSRIDILNAYADSAWKINPNAYIILEHFCDNDEETVLSNMGMMPWSNGMYVKYEEAAMGYNDGSKSDFSNISYKKRGWDDPHLVGYMESHDEERMMYKNETYSNSAGNYNIQDTLTGLSRIELAAAFFFTVPGPKMIWQFGELGYDYSKYYNINTGEVEDGNDAVKVDPKPIKWDYQDEWRRRHLFYVFQALINLKKNEDVFKTDNFELNVSGALKRIGLTSSDMSVVIIGNFDVVPGQIDPNFYFKGIWYDYFEGDSLNVTDLHDKINLNPGEYRIYTSKKLETPDFVGIDENKVVGPVNDFIIFPNPSSEKINIGFDIKKPAEVRTSIHNLQGQLISVEKSHINKGLQSIQLDISTLKPGLYLITIQDGVHQLTKKLMVN